MKLSTLQRKMNKIRTEYAKENAIAIHMPYSTTYKPTKGIFRFSKLMVDPVNEIATSYDWYTIMKRIDGILYVNTYAYSNATSKHINTLCWLLRELGMKFTIVEYAKGLGGPLDEISFMLAEYGRETVRNRHTKYKCYDYTNMLRTKLVKKHVTPDLLIEAIELAETNRGRALERARIERIERKYGSLEVYQGIQERKQFNKRLANALSS